MWLLNVLDNRFDGNPRSTTTRTEIRSFGRAETEEFLFAGSHAASRRSRYISRSRACRLYHVDRRAWLIFVLNRIRITPTERYTLLQSTIDSALLRRCHPTINPIFSFITASFPSETSRARSAPICSTRSSSPWSARSSSARSRTGRSSSITTSATRIFRSP